MDSFQYVGLLESNKPKTIFSASDQCLGRLQRILKHVHQNLTVTKNSVFSFFYSQEKSIVKVCVVVDNEYRASVR